MKSFQLTNFALPDHKDNSLITRITFFVYNVLFCLMPRIFTIKSSIESTGSHAKGKWHSATLASRDSQYIAVSSGWWLEVDEMDVALVRD